MKGDQNNCKKRAIRNAKRDLNVQKDTHNTNLTSATDSEC